MIRFSLKTAHQTKAESLRLSQSRQKTPKDGLRRLWTFKDASKDVFGRLKTSKDVKRSKKKYNLKYIKFFFF